MVKMVLHARGTLHLLLFAITLKYYAHGQRILLTDDDGTLPPLPPPVTIATDPIRTTTAKTEPKVSPLVMPPMPISPLAPFTSPNNDQIHPTFSFFMHDIFGGSAPSGRVVAGGSVANNKDTSGIPFSKPNKGVFPKSHAVPLITASQLPQQLLFGTITVIDDELTEGQELGTSMIGKAQGFYLASSKDGTSHTMAFTAMFHYNDDHDKDDAINFFGVHRTAEVESPIAIVGGTGKYKNAQGYAIIDTLQNTNPHTTDGIDTLLRFSVFSTH